MPSAESRKAASMGAATPTAEAEMDCRPLMREILSLGTSRPLTTADAGDCSAFIRPVSALAA